MALSAAESASPAGAVTRAAGVRAPAGADLRADGAGRRDLPDARSGADGLCRVLPEQAGPRHQRPHQYRVAAADLAHHQPGVLVTMLVIDHPVWRVASMATISFACPFLASASKLRPVAGIVALIVGYALDLLGSVPVRRARDPRHCSMRGCSSAFPWRVHRGQPADRAAAAAARATRAGRSPSPRRPDAAHVRTTRRATHSWNACGRAPAKSRRG